MFECRRSSEDAIWEFLLKASGKSGGENHQEAKWPRQWVHCRAEFGNSLGQWKNQVTIKLRRKKRVFYLSQTKDYNPGNRSGKLQELLHWSGVRDAVSYTFETKKLWTISTVSIAQSRFLFFFPVMHAQQVFGPCMRWKGNRLIMELQYYSAGLWRSGPSSSHRLISSPCSEEVWFTYNVNTRYTPGKACHEGASHLSFFFFLSLVVLPQNIFYFPHHLQR